MGVFGAFVNLEPVDRLGYFGNGQSFLFRFEPEFRVFNTYNTQGGQNYFYLNSKKMQSSSYPCGIGFGGEDYTNFRLWLDNDLSEKCQSGDYDKTYENGALTDSATKYLKVDIIEVWGFPDDITEKRQLDFRKMEADVILSNRKLDKKEFLDNGSNGIFFEKQFAFKDKLNIDFDHDKEMQAKKD